MRHWLIRGTIVGTDCYTGRVKIVDSFFEPISNNPLWCEDVNIQIPPDNPLWLDCWTVDEVYSIPTLDIPDPIGYIIDTLSSVGR